MYGMTGPLNLGLPDTQIRPKDNNDQYPVYTGRTIYQQLTISNLNKMPIELHRNRALRGFTAELSEEFPEGEEVCDTLLIEPGAAFHWTPDAEWEPLTNLLSADSGEFWQLVQPTDKWLFRRFVLLESSWAVQDYDPATMEPTAAPVSMPAGDIRIYEAGCNLLGPTQWTFQRLEQIRWDIRQETSDFALSMLIIGMVSPNPEDALAKLEQGKRIANIPGQGAQVERVGDSRVVDQLAEEYRALETEYFRACHIMDTTDQPNRPVGFDLQLRMEPQTAFVESLRRKIVDVYRMIGYTGEITFRRLETMTPADKQAELNNIMLAEDRRWITPQEAALQAKALFT